MSLAFVLVFLGAPSSASASTTFWDSLSTQEQQTVVDSEYLASPQVSAATVPTLGRLPAMPRRSGKSSRA
jgi:hypothetical protein